MMVRKKFHVDHDVRPAHVTAVLRQLSPFVGEVRSQLLTDLAASGHKINPHYLLWNLKVLRALGLTDVDPKTDAWRLTKRGVYLRTLAEWNQRAFHDMMHYLYYAAWDCGDKETATFSWTYQIICNLIWQSRPTVIDAKALAAQARDLARQEFGLEDVSITDYAVDGVYNWLRMLEPPFAWTDTKTRRRETNTGRSSCTPELFLMAIDYLYHAEGALYDYPLPIDDRRVDTLCRLCLLEPSQWRAMAARTAERFPTVSVVSSANGYQLILQRAPRLIVWSGEGDVTAADIEAPPPARAAASSDVDNEEDDEDDDTELDFSPRKPAGPKR